MALINDKYHPFTLHILNILDTHPAYIIFLYPAHLLNG